MKKQTKIIVLLSVLLGVIALITTLTTTFVLWDKKKQEKELEDYLDSSIM